MGQELINIGVDNLLQSGRIIITKWGQILENAAFITKQDSTMHLPL